MRKKVYDDVDYDYPKCGGHTVYDLGDSWAVKVYSNYMGQYDGRCWRIPKSEAKTIDGALSIVNSMREADFVTRKGSKVR